MKSENSPTSRDLQRRETFVRVFEAALEEFHRVGVEQSRIREICSRAGVAKGTFFFHFPTKDHVLLERQRMISEAMARRIDDELGKVNTAKAFLGGLTSIILDEHRALGDLELVRQINLVLIRHSGDPHMKIDLTAFGVSLSAQIRRLQRAGVIRKGIKAERLADVLRMSFFGFLANPHSSFKTAHPRITLMAGLLTRSLAA